MVSVDFGATIEYKNLQDTPPRTEDPATNIGEGSEMNSVERKLSVVQQIFNFPAGHESHALPNNPNVAKAGIEKFLDDSHSGQGFMLLPPPLVNVFSCKKTNTSH